ncbi:hypothetical protein, partial [Photobacterium minamisatsumaniensis]|uniref:hypothetical protein n=1 Tax=Photobacterium minamisatsumaniensis TaxID=2910233 RepID=UPI003D0A28C6
MLKLAVVIHAEEEFDWACGFDVKNQTVTHCTELLQLVNELLSLNAKVTLALDYAFISSPSGKMVIKELKPLQNHSIEFAAHLHPWVTPPYDSKIDYENGFYSFPGNLPRDVEYKKMKVLTEGIHQLCGQNPKAYLAGRYGVGQNTYLHLESLGYCVDLSINAYFDFSEKGGPDYSKVGCSSFNAGKIKCLPHTSSIYCSIPYVERKINKSPDIIYKLKNKIWYKLLKKLLKVNTYRLSPEGCSLEKMKNITSVQEQLGVEEFVLSFHSSSLTVKGTPYSESVKDVDELKLKILEYIKWFMHIKKGQCFLPSNFSQDFCGKKEEQYVSIT